MMEIRKLGESGLTQQEIADRIGVSNGFVCALLKGTRGHGDTTNDDFEYKAR